MDQVVIGPVDKWFTNLKQPNEAEMSSYSNLDSVQGKSRSWIMLTIHTGHSRRSACFT
jgi:hypothetical protein